MWAADCALCVLDSHYTPTGLAALCRALVTVDTLEVRVLLCRQSNSRKIDDTQSDGFLLGPEWILQLEGCD